MEQAGKGSGTTQECTHKAYGEMREVHSDGGGREGCFAYQPGHGGQRVPGISQEGKSFAPQATVDRQALEVPALKSAIAAFGGIAGLMVKAFPGR
jgi:hypothetical protein